MYKVIVVGTDGSSGPLSPPGRHLPWPKRRGRHSDIVHVMRLVAMASAGFGDPSAIASANADVRDLGDSIREHSLAEAERYGVSAVVHNVDGDPADMLVKVAETVQADLVVIGNRGMTGVKRLASGACPTRCRTTARAAF